MNRYINERNYTNEEAVTALNIMLDSYCNRCGYELVISQPGFYYIRYDIRCRDLGVGRTHHVYISDLEHEDLHQLLTHIINEAEKAFDEAARTKGRGGQNLYITTAGVRSGRYPWSDAFAAYCKADVEATKVLHGDWLKKNIHLPKTDKTPEIKDVIFADPATIVFWADGTKTVVRAQDGDTYDPEKGLAMAICKKVGGNKWSYYNKFKHWLKKIKPESDDVETVTYTTKVIKED